MNGDLKLTFIQKVLNEYMEEVIIRMAALGKNAFHGTGDGIASLSYKSALQGNGAEAALSFNDYLRFVDMGVTRKHPLGGLKAVSVELITRKGGKKLVKDNTFKARKIYSKVAYGKLSPMYNKLLYGFTEETIAMLKLELSKTNAP